jgi:hypothetical protein
MGTCRRAHPGLAVQGTPLVLTGEGSPIEDPQTGWRQVEYSRASHRRARFDRAGSLVLSTAGAHGDTDLCASHCGPLTYAAAHTNPSFCYAYAIAHGHVHCRDVSNASASGIADGDASDCADRSR